jgi:hypothetical protein
MCTPWLTRLYYVDIAICLFRRQWS